MSGRAYPPLQHRVDRDRWQLTLFKVAPNGPILRLALDEKGLGVEIYLLLTIPYDDDSDGNDSLYGGEVYNVFNNRVWFMKFALHPRLAADTLPLGDLPLCRVLLMNNRHFPWLILVPRLPDAVELVDLGESDYTAATVEIRHAAQAIQHLFRPYKLNIATLGNQVRQLHIHLVARYENDAAWPNPVWGSVGQAYGKTDLASRIAELQQALFK